MRVFSLRDEWQSWAIIHGDWAGGDFSPCRAYTGTHRVKPRSKFDQPGASIPVSADAASNRVRSREQKIAAIRIAIAEGRYHVSSSDLAQALMDHLLAKRRPAPIS